MLRKLLRPVLKSNRPKRYTHSILRDHHVQFTRLFVHHRGSTLCVIARGFELAAKRACLCHAALPRIQTHYVLPGPYWPSGFVSLLIDGHKDAATLRLGVRAGEIIFAVGV